jgi:hypothetical protein
MSKVISAAIPLAQTSNEIVKAGATSRRLNNTNVLRETETLNQWCRQILG